MTERTHIPSSPACGQWETLLADALDGLLKPEDEATFASHMAACPACTALFEESRKGREWLEFLSPEPEVPAGLLDKILAQTGPGQIAGFGLMAGAGTLPLPHAGVAPWQRPGVMGSVRRFAEPRLLMTAAMAFFSIALTLNMTGVRLTGMRLSDLRPTAVRSFMERRLTMASVPIIRYYDHLRFVYEIQTRMREFRGDETEDSQQQKTTQPGESRQNAPQNSPRKEGGSRVDPPQQSGDPAVLPQVGPTIESSTDLYEISPTLHAQPAHSGGSASASRERSMIWTA